MATAIQEKYILAFKQNGEGAEIILNKVAIRFRIMTLIQFFHVGKQEGNMTLIGFWQKDTLIKTVAKLAGVKIRDIRREGIRELFTLHDTLIEAHFRPEIWQCLKAMYLAGGAYEPINDAILAKLSPEIFSDLQNYKLAAALLKQLGKYEESMRFVFEGQSVGLDTIIPAVMQNWRGMYALKGERKEGEADIKETLETLKPYRALHKTIQQWRGKVPDNITELRDWKLEKPLHPEQVRLLLELGNVDIDAHIGTVLQHWSHIIQHSSVEEIRMLVNLPMFREPNRFTRNHSNPYREFLTYLRDGARMLNDPFTRFSSLHSMWRASVKAHEEQERRDQHQRQIERQKKLASQKEWMATKTQLPPKDLPEYDDGVITFLDTVLAVNDEGDAMNHCVFTAGYGEKAVAGNCYLFHVEYAGDDATAELLPNGNLNQIKGPYNRQNKACRWGTVKLAEWVATWGKE